MIVASSLLLSVTFFESTVVSLFEPASFMTTIDWKWEFDRQIPSRTDGCPQVIKALLDALEEFNWGDEDRFAIRMAIEEALVNAIKHGNEGSPDKPVHVVMRFSDTLFYAKITDQGAGFDPGCVVDPTADENVDKPNGRGVMLMKTFVDSVNYNGTGNEVEMTKRRSGDQATPKS